ncbi:hypothetical protein ACHQM5_008308 [Ranunculus cassubicifolius]
MVEISSSSSSSSSTSSSSSSITVDQQHSEVTKKKKKTSRSGYPDDEQVELIECSGKYCSSCTASIVADCIAVCCCPCAIANLVILTFVKVPYMMGRRCLGFMKKKRRMLGKKEKKKTKKKKNEEQVMERNGNLRKDPRVIMEESSPENLNRCENGEEEPENFSASYEAERVWLEMYQLGHLGFGRVSFSGVPEKIN